MRLLLATRQLDGPGGAESYLLTVAEGLRRLGHDISFTAQRIGPSAAGAVAAGFTVLDTDAAERAEVDAVIVQDRALSLRLARSRPTAPQVFVVHGVEQDYELPQPGVPIVSTAVVLNDRHAPRVAALEAGPPIARLRQPIDMLAFKPLGRPRDRVRKALVLSNNFPPARRDVLERAWGSAGVEIAALGRNDALGIDGTTDADPRAAIASADVVVGYGRAMLEAMACGRAAFVFAGPGGDGWVTPSSYPALEADGFTGGAFGDVYDESRMRDALADYAPELGQIGRDLVRFPHDARAHVAELAELLSAARPGVAVSDDRLRELERMVQMLWQAEGRVATLRIEAASLYEELHRRERQHEATVRSRRYRIAGLLAKPLDFLRRLLRRR
jgi:hypothetical protein